MRSVARIIGGVVVLLAVYITGAWLGLYGRHRGPGVVTRVAIPADVVAARTTAQRGAAEDVGARTPKQILFGDLHVHTTFSTDAFLWSLPMLQGDGAHPIADACDYARYCSALDFWSINDHAEASTPARWQETRETIRQCNAVSGDPRNPDVAIFLGWEWSQVGRTPQDHYGHKNVIFLDLDDDKVPARAIGAAGIATSGLRSTVGRMSPTVALLEFPHSQPYYDFIRFMEETDEVPSCPDGVPSPKLPPGCYESAATPHDLFRKLDEWGFDTIVIPHGNTWGFYSPPGISWDKQLTPAEHDPQKQTIIEVMSGHGNSEEYRDWQEVQLEADGTARCPEPRADYLPSCWRAGQLTEERCRRAGGNPEQCAQRAAEAKRRYANMGVAGHLMVPDAEVEEWLDAGQCRDCFLPAFNYRPGGSTQYALAISNFETPEHPGHFRFGFIASSDNHRARPGTGYKEFDRLHTSEAGGARNATWRQRLNRRREGFDPWAYDPTKPADLQAAQDRIQAMGFMALEGERQASFFVTGGLAAVHASGRSREDIWRALKRKEIYGTSGDRLLLWFDLLNAGEGEAVPMGGEVRMDRAPRFEVRAVGAFKQRPGCPAESTRALAPERLANLCRGECYNPSDERKLITRIEVIRIRPQIAPGEPVRKLIEDPWQVLPCGRTQAGCVVEFEDPEFATAARDTVYYVRAIEEPSPAVNGGQLRCERDERGECLRVRPCYGDYRTPASDDCLAPIEERAWSSPIYVDYAAAP
ncbi:MAG TPA: DUF3604 domain-containing protein [Candidatus Nitrosopolaris sp.]|nr:DUF3604 domain-containing protein [Candidatus Nitrosopolaris sp.]